ncbi:MAG: 3'-5' exonuclease [Paraprevotella sp.]|nr:3'-5' exonuclease [Paraprevotella sp.]
MRAKYIRSRYNWAEKYDQTNKKKGIISFNPPSIVVPFNYDYIRFYTGKKSTVFVVSKEFESYPQRRYALMSTKFELLTNYIFKNIDFRDWGCAGYLSDMHIELIHNDEIYSNFDLSLNDIERFSPFLVFEHDVADEYDEYNRPIRFHNEVAKQPFKNVRLFIDTETTGLPLNDNLPYTDLGNWPNLVQVALIIEDDNYGVLAKRNIILKPDGYSIPESATKIHGISNAKAANHGEGRNKVISFLDLALYNSDIIVGHNVSFDLNVIKSETIRIKGIENALFTKKKHSVIDTMKIGMNICKIPNLSFHSRLSQPYKYPKLGELYYKLFNKHFKNQHDAMVDIQATYDCYNKLIKL